MDRGQPWLWPPDKPGGLSSSCNHCSHRPLEPDTFSQWEEGFRGPQTTAEVGSHLPQRLSRGPGSHHLQILQSGAPSGRPQAVGHTLSSLTHFSFFKSSCSISCQERSVKILPWLWNHLLQFFTGSVLLHVLEYFSTGTFIIIDFLMKRSSFYHNKNSLYLWQYSPCRSLFSQIWIHFTPMTYS